MFSDTRCKERLTEINTFLSVGFRILYDDRETNISVKWGARKPISSGLREPIYKCQSVFGRSIEGSIHVTVFRTCVMSTEKEKIGNWRRIHKEVSWMRVKFA